MRPAKHVLLILILCALATACAGQAASDTATPSPVPGATGVPGPFFSPSSDLPVFTHGADDAWFSGAVEPGAIIFYDGQLHMFFNGLDGWPAQSGVGYAVSVDGITLDMALPGPILDSSAADFSGFTFFVSSVLQLADNSLAMYLYTLNEGRDGAPGAILVALAEELAGPWTLQPDPVLQPGEKGAWDGARVTQPHVLRIADGYRMYFSGYEDDRRQGGRRIGLAESQDGLTWSKLPEPVFSFSEDARDWDAFRVFQPRVVETPTGFLMLYKSNVSVGRSEAWGLAVSQDGIAWTRSPWNPLIDEKTYSIDWRRNGIGDLLFLDGELVLFLEILEREGGAFHHGNADYRSNIFRFTGLALP